MLFKTQSPTEIKCIKYNCSVSESLRVFVGLLYPFIYLFSNTKCFQLSLNVSTFTLCAPVGRGGKCFSWGSSWQSHRGFDKDTRGDFRRDAEICGTGLERGSFLGLVPVLLVAQWDGCATACAESSSDGSRRRRQKWKSLLSLVCNVGMMAWDGDFAGEALGLQAQGAGTKGIAHLAAGAPSHCFSQKCHSSAQMCQLCVYI